MEVTAYLDAKGITYITHTHPAVFTCEEADRLASGIPGMRCKNLFLKDSVSGAFFLAVMPAEKRLDLKRFAALADATKVRFGNEAELKDVLNLAPGSVSPFGLLNDTEHKVHVFVDKGLMASSIVGFHPNVNTKTLELTTAMFRKYLESLENPIRFADL